MRNANKGRRQCNEDQIAGTAKNLGGKVEEAAGRAAREMKTQVQGKVDQAVGTAQDLYGQVRATAQEAGAAVQSTAQDAATAVRESSASFEQAIRTSVEARSLMTAAVALGIGWLLGRMLHSS
jgi:uncharacterized protein YjbJ (UPF0337 family)